MKAIFQSIKRKKKNAKVKNEDKKRIEFLKVERLNNILKITNVQECTVVEYFKELQKYLDTETINKMTIDSFSINTLMERTNRYFIETENATYNIIGEYPSIKINERLRKEDCVEENVLEMNLCQGEYRVSVLIHNEMFSTISNKTFSSTTVENDLPEAFRLDKDQAIKKIVELLKNVGKIQNIQKVLSIDLLYRGFHLISEDEYNSVIDDERICLSWRFHNINSKPIEEQRMVSFDIVLKETKELIGDISFDYIIGEGFTYAGNVSYFVNPEFRHQHYATDALHLLKQLLKENHFEGDKDLYIATEMSNQNSAAVAINNGGELVYEGEVPDGELIKTLDGVKNVKVYRIRV